MLNEDGPAVSVSTKSGDTISNGQHSVFDMDAKDVLFRGSTLTDILEMDELKSCNSPKGNHETFLGKIEHSENAVARNRYEEE